MEECEEVKRQKNLYVELCDQANKKSAKDMVGLLVFMEKSAATAAVERFPRGVVRLGVIVGSRYIPTYVVEF
eukprot:8884906-Lingulodinium_polyedra.AAC.1